jgi:hypothetical protein
MTLASTARVAGMTLLAGAAFVACTLMRPLDYLTSGVADGGIEEGGGSGSDADGDAAAAGRTLAEGQFSPRNLAQDSDALYWSTADGAIMSVPKAGGTARKVADVADTADISWIAADNGAVGDLFVIVDGAVERVPKTGGELTMVESDTLPALALAVDDESIFVIHSDPDAVQFGFLARYARDGSKRVVLSVEDDDPRAVALFGSSVFWSGSTIDYGAIFELPKNAPPDAGAGATVHRGPRIDDAVYADTPTAFTVDDEAIYFNEVDVTYRLERSQTTPAVMLFEPPEGVTPVAFADDAQELFIVNQREKGSIIRIAKAGGPPAALAADLPAPTAAVADESAVYITLQGSGVSPDGAVIRLEK